MFQSLLSWNGLVNAAPEPSSARVHDVSILVVVERPGQPEASRRRGSSLEMFQSLLSWNGLVNTRSSGSPGRDTRGFNPCCRGTAWSTAATWGHVKTVIEVSILVVVERPGQLGGRRGEAGTGRDVSILVVVERPGQPPTSSRRSLTTRPSFNPCCRGTAWSTCAVGRSERADWTGFNPCCRGTAWSTRCMRGCPRRWIRGFNPCCRGTAWSTGDGRLRRNGIPTVGFNPCCRGTAWSTPATPTAIGVAEFQSLLSWNGLVNPWHPGRPPRA